MDETGTPIPAEVVRTQLRAAQLSANRLQSMARSFESREVAGAIAQLHTAIEALAEHAGIELAD